MENRLQINLPETGDYILNGLYQRLFVKHDNITTMIINLHDFNESISKINNILENFIILSNDEIREYFESIFSNSINIKSINGIRLEVDLPIEYSCDYCFNNIEYIDTDYYYYCYKCHNNICMDCFRKEFQEQRTCKYDHSNKIKKRNFCTYNSFYINCDECSEKIIEPLFYSDESDLINSYDICIDCYEKYPEIQETRDLYKIECIFPCDNCNFGNMLDWIPLLKDKDNSYILINKNTMEYCVSTRINAFDSVYFVLDLDTINDFINNQGRDDLIIFSMIIRLGLV